MLNWWGSALYGLTLAAFTVKAAKELMMAREWWRREKVWARRAREAQTRSVDQ